MKRRVLLGYSLLATLGVAQADECASLPPPSVTIKRLDGDPAFRQNYGYRQLTALGAERSRPGLQVLGLTRGKAVVRYENKMPALTDLSGRWECSSPQITLHYGFQPLTVFVAREFAAGSCAYQEIHAHEMRHVDTYRKHSAAIEQEIVATLQQRFVAKSPWRGPTGEMQQRLAQEMEQRWIPYISRLLNKAEADQALIDTPEEYEKVAASCQGEIRRILSSQRETTARR